MERTGNAVRERGAPALDVFFRPQAVAVVGASHVPGKIGHIVVRNLQESGYTGRIVPVNPKGGEIRGLPVAQSLSEAVAEGPIDLVVIAVPAPAVVDVAEEAGRVGVRGLVVLSAGFRETGPEGARREAALLEVVRRHSMRLLGPNVVGVVDTHTPLNATFAEGFPNRGEVAFVSQSGALLLAIHDWARKEGMGFSRFLSLGNKTDLDESDALAALAEDPNTRVILLYLEDVRDGRRFLEAARRAVREKPVVVLKSGRSDAGARAAASHTGALAGSDRAYEAAFRQSGVLRVNSLEELFAAAWAFLSPRYPKGKKVAVLTNAGGGGILASDALAARGLELSSLSRNTIRELRETLPPEASALNPVDVLGDARADRYARAAEILACDPETDGILAIVCPTATAEPEKTAQVLAETAARFDLPLTAAFMGGEAMEAGVRRLREARIPVYAFSEAAAEAWARLVAYGELRMRSQMPTLWDSSKRHQLLGEGDIRQAEEVFARVRAEGRRVLLSSEVLEVLAAFGIPGAPTRLARTAREAAAIAEEFGYPVALKIASPDILHKSDIGGVRLGLADAGAVQRAFREIVDAAAAHVPDAFLYGVEVQKMLARGHEVFVGGMRDPTFGPLLVVGMGGVFVNLLEDVAYRLVEPLTERDVEEIFRETRLYRLLRGFRGEPPADLASLHRIVARVAELLRELPDVFELDLNPVFASPDGAWVVDAKLTLREERGTAPSPAGE